MDYFPPQNQLVCLGIKTGPKRGTVLIPKVVLLCQWHSPWALTGNVATGVEYLLLPTTTPQCKNTISD